MYVTDTHSLLWHLQNDEKLKTASNYRIYPLDEDVAFECSKINMKEHHDRIIVATARLLGKPLITNDGNIRKSKLVETVW